MLRAVFSLGAITIISLALIPVQWLAVRMEWPLRRSIPTFYHRTVCAILGVHIRQIGRRIAEHPLLIVSNHTSWLDISVITAVAPVVFVASVRAVRQAAELSVRRSHPPLQDRRGQ